MSDSDSKKVIFSLGIDIGTTTSQVIFSRLVLINRAAATQVPHYEFVERKIIFQSAITITPIDQHGIVDAEKLFVFIEQQFALAGLQRSDIETGAVIITGETAKAKNARDAVMSLADAMGDFVVASAGPHLESIIAGKGSGAAEYSKQHNNTVLNIDIGGGTSNYAVFEAGKVVDSSCVNIGGRLLRTKNGRPDWWTDIGAEIASTLFEGTVAVSEMTQAKVEQFADAMADVVIEHIGHTGALSPLADRLAMTAPLRRRQLDGVFISGGVGDCFYQMQAGKPVGDFNFDDIGALLAQSLLRKLASTSYPILQPKHTVRATVIGAGAHSLSLSGSTICLNQQPLPIKNIPVVHPSIDWSAVNSNVAETLLDAVQRMDLDPATDVFAFGIDQTMPVNYSSVNRLADEIAAFYNRYSIPAAAIIVVLQHDLGKVLGMELQGRMPQRSLAIVDEVYTQEGDYVDIGKSLFGGNVVPLTVKSLAFPS